MVSVFGAIWEDPEGGCIKFAVKRASKQDKAYGGETSHYSLLKGGVGNLITAGLLAIIRLYMIPA